VLKTPIGSVFGLTKLNGVPKTSIGSEFGLAELYGAQKTPIGSANKERSRNTMQLLPIFCWQQMCKAILRTAKIGFT
jgi:hypothetical protein